MHSPSFVGGEFHVTTEMRDDLFRLLEALCDERLDEEAAAQLEAMVVNDAEARRMFVEYVSLHGLLYWDAAPDAGSLDIESILRSGTMPVPVSRRRSLVMRATVSAAAALLVLVTAFIVSRNHVPPVPAGGNEIAVEPPKKEPAGETTLPKIVLSGNQPDSTPRLETTPGTKDPGTANAPASGDVVARLDQLF